MVGTLVFSLAVGITVPDISGKAVANLGYSSVLHLNPVFIGDTLYACSEILTKTPSKTKSDRGVITVQTRVRNQNNLPVLEFQRQVLVYRESAKNV